MQQGPDVVRLAAGMADLQREVLRQAGKDAQVRFRRAAQPIKKTGELERSIQPRLYGTRVRVGSGLERSKVHNITSRQKIRVDAHTRRGRPVKAHDRKLIRLEFISARLAEQDLDQWERQLQEGIERLLGVR